MKASELLEGWGDGMAYRLLYVILNASHFLAFYKFFLFHEEDLISNWFQSYGSGLLSSPGNFKTVKGNSLFFKKIRNDTNRLKNNLVQIPNK